MSQIEILRKMLVDMDKNINQLNEYIQEKELMIEHNKNRIEELNANLITEKNALAEAVLKREKMTEMQSEVESNFNQINESVNTLVEILKTKIN
jgi:hypothetical protein